MRDAPHSGRGRGRGRFLVSLDADGTGILCRRDPISVLIATNLPAAQVSISGTMIGETTPTEYLDCLERTGAVGGGAV